MRVLHLDAGRRIRGGQRQLRLLMRGLERRGVEQVLLARGELAEAESAENLTASAVRRQARRADLIHAHDARSHTIAALVAAGVPLVVSRRVAFPIRRGPLSRWKYGRADRFLAVSEYVARQLRQAGIASERVRVVHDGVDVQEAPLDPPSGDMVTAGILAIDDPLKLSDLALEGCRQAGVASIADGCLERLLDNSDFLLYLTAEEGLGSALIAAAAHGRPAVASRVGGVPEVVEHERTGLLVENDDAEIAAALKRLAEDRELLRACAAAAFERAGARFSSDIMVTRTLEAYHELLHSES